MKTLLSILFLFVCAFAHAQYHNVEGIRVVGRSDSTTISNVGQIQFDADDDKFRFNDGTGWFSFMKEGASAQGWPLTGSANLTGGTTIVTDGNPLHFKVSDTEFTVADSLFITGDLFTDPGPIVGVTSDWPNFTTYAIIGYLDQTVGGETAFMKIGGDFGIPHKWSFYDYRTNKTGIEYANPDTTDWTGNTLATRDYVRQHVGAKIDDAKTAFWNNNSAPTLDPELGVYTIAGGSGDDLFISMDSTIINIDDMFTAGGITYSAWYRDVVDNSGGITPDDDTRTFNFFVKFSSSEKVVTTVKTKAVATELSTGDGYYAGEKVFVLLWDGGDITLLDSETIYELRDDESATHTVAPTSPLATITEITVTTPAGKEYMWKVSMEVHHASFTY